MKKVISFWFVSGLLFSFSVLAEDQICPIIVTGKIDAIRANTEAGKSIFEMNNAEAGTLTPKAKILLPIQLIGVTQFVFNGNLLGGRDMIDTARAAFFRGMRVKIKLDIKAPNCNGISRIESGVFTENKSVEVSLRAQE